MKIIYPVKRKKDVNKMLSFYRKKDNYNLKKFVIAAGLFNALKDPDVLFLKPGDLLTKEGCIKAV